MFKIGAFLTLIYTLNGSNVRKRRDSNQYNFLEFTTDPNLCIEYVSVLKILTERFSVQYIKFTEAFNDKGYQETARNLQFYDYTEEDKRWHTLSS